MPKYITVKLTKEQLDHTIYCVEIDCNPDFSMSDPLNAFNMRIVNKLRKAKSDAIHGDSARRINEALAKARAESQDQRNN